MLKLSSPDLPTEAIAASNAGSFVRLFKPDGFSMGPFVNSNLYSKYGPDPGFEAAASNMGYPNLVGQYHRFATQFEIYALTIASDFFSIALNPLSILPRQAWTDTRAVNFYASRNHPLAASEAIQIQAIAKSVVPAPVSFVYNINIAGWNQTAITQVESLGLVFSPAIAVNSPQPGEFIVDGNVLKLYGSQIFNPKVNAELLITLEAEFLAGEAICAIATFNLFGTGVTYIDTVEYLGMTFTPAKNPGAPDVNRFFWDKTLLTLFIDFALAGALPSLDDDLTFSYDSKIGSLNFTITS
jgi:hypothetical protein